jgi:hypothetical protein
VTFQSDDRELDSYDSELARLAALLEVCVQLRELFLRLEFYDSKYVNWSMEQLNNKTVEIYSANKKPPG